MRLPFLLLSALCGASVCGQLYPEADAVWCGFDGEGEPFGHEVQFLMGSEPDTSINGMTYKVVEEHHGQAGAWEYIQAYYVRSALDGRGYVYLPDSLAEYLTGDALALTGDTVHDVLVRTPPFYYALRDIVVDSVITLSNDGVTVVRHHVHGSNWTMPEYTFWQAGMGLNTGPLIDLQEVAWYAEVDNVVQFSILEEGLPGGDAWCESYASVAESDFDPLILIHHDPSSGDLLIRIPGVVPNGAAVRLLDSSGRAVNGSSVRSNPVRLDASDLHGFYIVRVFVGTLAYTGRVVIP